MVTRARILHFKNTIWNFYKLHKRTMPWRETRDPYKIFVSEIMLQQTQVSRVTGKYALFIKLFPNFLVLKNAPLKEVLRAWQGMGYNRRALFLKKAAEKIVNEYGGKLPKTRAELESLPGIGRGTSGSIMAFAFQAPEVFIETNIRRVFIHFFFKERKKVRDKEIEQLVEKALDKKNPREWYYALMDYGAWLKNEVKNPNKKSFHYKLQSKFPGSSRELRGKIIKIVSLHGGIHLTQLKKYIGNDPRFQKVIRALVKEGFFKLHRNHIFCVDNI